VTCTLDGFLYGNQRVRREAVKHLVTAAELDPSNSRVFKDLAALYEEAGMPRKAEYYMDRAMVLGEVSAQYDQRPREAR
jgi:Flp pilus assembly protein TadD